MRRLKQIWREFRQDPAGHRFRNRHRRHMLIAAKNGLTVGRLLAFFAALLCLVIAIPLMVLPGPAIVFFAIAGVILASESRFLATLFDYVELLGRSWIRRWQTYRKRRVGSTA
jgi:hypothetical protein